MTVGDKKKVTVQVLDGGVVNSDARIEWITTSGLSSIGSITIKSVVGGLEITAIAPGRTTVNVFSGNADSKRVIVNVT